MFFIRYIGAELRRRKGRTALTALGLGVGVGLVVTVSALSAGLDDAQSEVLEPLTAVGTDMTVTKPLGTPGEDGEGGGPPPGRFGLDNLGDPGERFSEQQFLTPNSSFSAKQADRATSVGGVDAVSAALTVDQIGVSGRVSDASDLGHAPPTPGEAPVGGAPDSIGFDATTISGIDTADPSLALVTPDQITEGEYLDGAKQAVVSTSYASENEVEVGDRIDVGDAEVTVVGLASAPIGGESSDVYVELGTLQKLADRKGEVNVISVRADDADSVGAVADSIEASVSGAEVTTTQELADQVSGSLVDAQDLSGKLGTALAAAGLIGAVAIASLLTLSAVNKRTRELGTLKALGWKRRTVVRQIAGESLAQGLLGGVAGAAIGVGGAALVGALGISLEATVEAASSGFGPPGGGPGGPPGAEAATEAPRVVLGAPVDVGLVILAIALATGAGLASGALGAARAARLRPAEALRSVE